MNTRTEIITHTVRLANGVMRVKHKLPQRKTYALHIEQKLPFYDYNPIEDDEYYADIIVVGNSGNGGYAELYDSIVGGAILGDMDYMVLNYNRNGYKNVSEVIEDYLGVKPNKYQTGKVKKYLEERYGKPNSHYYNEDLIADLMTLFTPYHWETALIRGCVQGECAEIVYPSELYSKTDIEVFEAYYFRRYMDYCATYKGEDWWFTYCDFIGEDEILDEIASEFGKNVKVEYTPYSWW